MKMPATAPRHSLRKTAALLALLLAASGCGASADDDKGPAADPQAVEDGKAEATEAIQALIGQPSNFPALEPLAESPSGKTITFIDQGTPFGAVVFSLLEGAAEVMGTEVNRIDAGHAADGITSAFNSIVARKPDALIVAGINMQLWKSQLAELQAADIPVVVAGVTGTKDFDIPSPQAAEPYSDVSGRMAADYTTAELGTDSNVVVYTVPELTFTADTGEVIADRLDEVCPNCTVRTVPIPIATMGNTAPSTIVRDLQSHPDTTVGIFPNNEVAVGLPAALSAAGLELEIVGMAPGPAELQMIQNGEQAVGVAFDMPVFAWGLLDQAARLMAGQELTGEQAAGIPVQQFLTAEDITFDPSHGWTGYPDFAERYAAVWGAGS